MAAAVKTEKEETQEEPESKEVDVSKPKSARDLIWECFQKVGGVESHSLVPHQTPKTQDRPTELSTEFR